MKLNLPTVLFVGLLVSMAPQSLMALAVNASAALSVLPTIALEQFGNHENAEKAVMMKGTNIVLQSNLSSKPELSLVWIDAPHCKAYKLSGKGTMQPGGLYIEAKNASSQFTIESGITLCHSHMVADCGKLIFKGEFLSLDYLDARGGNNTPIISICEKGAIDFNQATLKHENRVPIDISGGSMIRDKHNVTKNHTLTFSESSSFIGDLWIDADATLRVYIDPRNKGANRLNVSGNLNFWNNSCIDFEQMTNNHPVSGKKKVELKSGTIIATAASINSFGKGAILDETILSGISITESISNFNYDTRETSITTTPITDMQLVAIKNGERYDLVLRRIKSKDKN